jgi:hypothetical protein
MSPGCLGLEVILLGARLCLGTSDEAKTVTIAVCPVIVARDRDFQARLGAGLRALPPAAATQSAIAEWLSLRD